MATQDVGGPTICPSAHELLAFSTGELSEEALVSISDHVGRCETCRGALESASSQPGALVSRLKHALRMIEGEEDAACQNLVVSASRFWSQFERFAQTDSAEAPAEAASESEPSTDPSGTGSATAVWPPPLPTSIGRHEVRSFLGGGKFGDVYLAYDPQLERQVALKLIGAASTPEVLREARGAAQLRHAGIVTIYEVGTDERGRHYIAMEYVPGGSLKELVRAGPQPARRVAAIIGQLAEAVHEAHKAGLVHRDLKPANILCEGERVKIADFGLALTEDRQRACAGEQAGTIAYMSPEQLRGEAHRLDGRTDLWALGVIMYELLAGRRPFSGTYEEVVDEILYRAPKPLRQMRDDVDPMLDDICLKCLAKEPDRRFSSGKDLAEALAAWKEASRSAPPRAPSRWSRAGWWAAAAIVLLAALAAGRQWLVREEVPFQLDGAGPLVPVRLLARPPVALTPASVAETWSYDANRQIVTVNSATPCLLALGEACTGEFKLEARLTNHARSGYGGLFVGVEELPPQGSRRRWKCLWVRVTVEEGPPRRKAQPPDKRPEVKQEAKDGAKEDENEGDPPDREPELVFLLEAVELTQNGPTGTLGDSKNTLAFARISKQPVNQSLLEITVHNNRIVEVRWQGRELAELSHLPRQWQGAKGDCAGQFGIVNMQGSTIFSDVRFTSLRRSRP
jgi:predicted Ser/Thr protein kinase